MALCLATSVVSCASTEPADKSLPSAPVSIDMLMSNLDAGVDPNYRFEDGKTAIYHAFMRGFGIDAIRALQQAGADPWIESDDSVTPLAALLRAERYVAPEELAAYVELGIDLNRLNSQSRSTLELTMAGSPHKFLQDNVISLIIAGADPSIIDRDGRDALALVPDSGEVCRSVQNILRLMSGLNHRQRVNFCWALNPTLYAGCPTTIFPAGSPLPFPEEVGGRNSSGQTALWLAMRQSEPGRIASLIKAGAKGPVDSCGITALSLAIENRDAKTVRLLIDSGADPNERDSDGMLPFVKAMRICSNSGMRPDMVRPLMYSDADLTLAAPSGESVSSLYASLSGSKKSELLSANKDAWFKYAVEMPHPQRMLLLGLVEGDMDRVLDWADRGAFVDVEDPAFKYAMANGPASSILYLAGEGMSPNVQDEYGRLPLDSVAPIDADYSGLAVYERALSLLRLGGVLSKDAPTDGIQRVAGDGPLGRLYSLLGIMPARDALTMDSAFAGRWDELLSLVSLGERTSMRDSRGVDLLGVAIEGGAPDDVILGLLRLGADPDSSDRKGRTNLMDAVARAYPRPVLEALVAGGARPFAHDGTGKSVSDYAMEGGRDLPSFMAGWETSPEIMKERYAAFVMAKARSGDRYVRVVDPDGTPLPSFRDYPTSFFGLDKKIQPEYDSSTERLDDFGRVRFYSYGDVLYYLLHERNTGKSTLRRYRIAANLELTELSPIDLDIGEAEIRGCREGRLWLSSSERSSTGSESDLLTELAISDRAGPFVSRTIRPGDMPVAVRHQARILRWLRSTLKMGAFDYSECLDRVMKTYSALDSAELLSSISTTSYGTFLAFPGASILVPQAFDRGSQTFYAVDAINGRIELLSDTSGDRVLYELSKDLFSNGGGYDSYSSGGAAFLLIYSNPVRLFDFSDPLAPISLPPLKMARGPCLFVPSERDRLFILHRDGLFERYSMDATGSLRPSFGEADFRSAIDRMDRERATVLAAAYVDVLRPDSSGAPEWFYAIENGDAAISVRLMVLLRDSFGYGVISDGGSRLGGWDGPNPLSYAISVGRLDVARALQEACPTLIKDTYDPPLFAAARSGSTEAIDLALELGAAPNAFIDQSTFCMNAISFTVDASIQQYLERKGVPLFIAPGARTALYLTSESAKSATLYTAPSSASTSPGKAPEGGYTLLGTHAAAALDSGRTIFWVLVKHQETGTEGWMPSNLLITRAQYFSDGD